MQKSSHQIGQETAKLVRALARRPRKEPSAQPAPELAGQPGSLAVATGSACGHPYTQGREGQTGSWCVKCGEKMDEVEPRECQHCAHFKDIGFPGYPRSICTKHLMGVTRTMHVTYLIAKGTCFSPNK